MEYKLRLYQDKGLLDCVEVMTGNNEKAMVVMPTGAGKSILIAKTIEQLDVPVLILQPSKELLKQNYLKYVKAGGEASIYCASLKKKTIKKEEYTEIDGEYVKCKEVSNVTYATIGSIKKEIHRLKKLGVKHVIIDEVHLQSKQGSQMRSFLKELKATHVLGLTATPIYLQGGMAGSRLVMINRTFATIFKKIKHVTQISELVKNKYWTPLNYKIIENDEGDLKLNTAGSDYTEHSQRLYYKSNNLKDQIVEEVNNLKKQGRKRILVFVPSIEEANSLYGEIPNSAIVHSKLSTEERDFMVDAFSNGDIPVAINVNVLATGYDNPEIDAIITARPTSSVALCYQQLGRGVRIHPDKKDCIIVDFSGNVKRFGRIEELEFKKIDYYGWGLFNGSNQLLTDYPIQSKIKPTIETLIREGKEKELMEKNKIKDTLISPKLWFGKYNGKTISQIHKENKNYLVWMYENFDFNGAKMKNLKKHIEKTLLLPSTVK